jgi:hypothetical protein
MPVALAKQNSSRNRMSILHAEGIQTLHTKNFRVSKK